MKTWAEMTERERDVLVFTKRFGCSEPEWRDGEPWYPLTGSVVIPNFSTDRAAAMTLLDGVETYILSKNKSGKFSCTVSNPKEHPVQTEIGATEAEAICRAFLCAKGINIE